MRASTEVTINTGEGPGLDLVSGTVTAEPRVGLASSGLPPGECGGGKGNELHGLRDDVFGDSFSGGDGIIGVFIRGITGIIGGFFGSINGALGNVIPVLILEGILDLGLAIINGVLTVVNGFIDGIGNGGGEAKTISVVAGARDG